MLGAWLGGRAGGSTLGALVLQDGVSGRPASGWHRRQRLSAPGARRHALPNEVGGEPGLPRPFPAEPAGPGKDVSGPHAVAPQPVVVHPPGPLLPRTLLCFQAEESPWPALICLCFEGIQPAQAQGSGLAPLVDLGITTFLFQVEVPSRVQAGLELTAFPLASRGRFEST